MNFSGESETDEIPEVEYEMIDVSNVPNDVDGHEMAETEDNATLHSSVLAEPSVNSVNQSLHAQRDGNCRHTDRSRRPTAAAHILNGLAEMEKTDVIVSSKTTDEIKYLMSVMHLHVPVQYVNTCYFVSIINSRRYEKSINCNKYLCRKMARSTSLALMYLSLSPK